MTYEELRADALALCADLSATADDGADLDPDSLKERRASEALSVLSGMVAGGAAVVTDADMGGYAYMAAHDVLSIAHAANAAWAEMTLVDE